MTYRRQHEKIKALMIYGYSTAVILCEANYICWRISITTKDTKTLPVFINYEKAADAIAYEDRFLSNSELIALSKHPRTVDSTDADHFYKRKQADKDNRIYLFVRRNKDDKEAKEFYFLGEIFAQGNPTQIQMETPTGKMDNAFEIYYHLDVPVRDDVYNYIVGD